MTAPDKISALWFLPTFGDGRYLGSPEYARGGISPISSRSRSPPTSSASRAC